jgi:hypothetical protein
VTSRLGTRKWQTFFYSVSLIENFECIGDKERFSHIFPKLYCTFVCHCLPTSVLFFIKPPKSIKLKSPITLIYTIKMQINYNDISERSGYNPDTVSVD